MNSEEDEGIHDDQTNTEGDWMDVGDTTEYELELEDADDTNVIQLCETFLFNKQANEQEKHTYIPGNIFGFYFYGIVVAGGMFSITSFLLLLAFAM